MGRLGAGCAGPWFILGLLAAAALVTWVPGLQPVGHVLAAVSRQVLVLTLFLRGPAIGAGIGGGGKRTCRLSLPWEYRRRRPEGTVLYTAVRDNLATLLEEASEVGRGLPRYVERDFARYLECGVLAHGFARVRCESCKDELLVAFSCKGRGVCPSCNAKRAHVTAAHLVERVLPHVPYRQWTLSFPHRVRWVLLKDVGLLSDVLTVFLRAGARPTTSASAEAGHPSWAGRGRARSSSSSARRCK